MKNKIKPIVFVLLAVFAFTFIAGLKPAFAAEKLPTVEKLWENIKKINPDLKDYNVKIKVKVQAKYQFMNPKIRLTGTYYFKKPDFHKLELDRASYFLNKYPKIFGWHLPKLAEFNSKVENTRFKGKECYLVSLTPKTISGDIKRQRLWVDKNNYTFAKHIYEYKKGGLITLEVKYRTEGKNILYDKMNASFNFPKEKLSATAKATYGKYQINNGYPDSFFPKEEKK